jgi:predicted dehydrogenase
MKEVRLGIVGVGGMGSNHAGGVVAGKIPRCKLTAVCDVNPQALRKFDDSVAKFADARAMFKANVVDAVLIATPHYDHTTVGIEALKRGLHVLVEKPISVHKADAERLLAAHANKKQVFAAMFNMRTLHLYRKIKEMLERKELGKLIRINWIVTTWFRTEFYYRNGLWRATWAGEGGGVLLNQCPHQLDMMQWFFGMPQKVQGFCAIGKHHDIEVEDEVTAYLEYANGATGVFITSTGETPGTNRLEITGDNGRLIMENETLSFIRNEVPISRFLKTEQSSFGRPPVWNVSIPVRSGGSQHEGILINFVEAILDGKPLIANAHEGLASVELGNAILYSSFTGKPVSLPLDGKSFERALKKKIKESKFKKTETVSARAQDMGVSFPK